MYMFLPFLLALAGCASVWHARAGLSYVMWGVRMVLPPRDGSPEVLVLTVPR